MSGLKNIKISKIDDFKKLLKSGEKARHYRQTDIHEHSSRSHTIFRILIENRLSETKKVILEKSIKNAKPSTDDGELPELDDVGLKHLSYGTKYSILNMVDLAGSERISESGDSQLKETSSINTSLFVLANVIYKLSENRKGNLSHIPYRESKLT